MLGRASMRPPAQKFHLCDSEVWQRLNKKEIYNLCHVNFVTDASPTPLKQKENLWILCTKWKKIRQPSTCSLWILKDKISFFLSVICVLLNYPSEIASHQIFLSKAYCKLKSCEGWQNKLSYFVSLSILLTLFWKLITRPNYDSIHNICSNYFFSPTKIFFCNAMFPLVCDHFK